ncbi:alkane 1-monooxygenase [Oleispira antarctica]|uniref:Alkane 1-monooxygenase n=1 Tax=Oleispira antarctica TaxID=188908 RepID=A0A1Y5HXP2_OLEAN|nr:alkane 1-monooxygenase [Oleispira antarctica]
MFHYLKYSSIHIMGLIAIISISLGESYIALGFAAWVAIYIGADLLFGDDTSEPQYKYPVLLTWLLWLALPILAMICFVSVWHFAPTDIFGYGAMVSELTGYDILLAKQNTDFIQYIILVIFTGLSIGVIGTITGHELTHRTWDPISMFIGRWLLSYSGDANFSIEHVYGHHRYVSTKDDPATAPRGRNVYAHILISTVRGNISAWKIEQARLAKKGQSTLSVHNVALRGYLMSAVLVVAAFLMAGWAGTLFFVSAMLWGKATLEIVNFMEHYGIVRNPQTPVQPRHSWNTNKRASSWAMFNLTRHSHHHAQGEVPYHELKPFSDAPMMVGGYLSTMVVALIPPLWNKLMIPKVLEWDQKYATREELSLANAANKISGLAEFEKVHYDVESEGMKKAMA